MRTDEQKESLGDKLDKNLVNLAIRVSEAQIAARAVRIVHQQHVEFAAGNLRDAALVINAPCADEIAAIAAVLKEYLGLPSKPETELALAVDPKEQP